MVWSDFGNERFPVNVSIVLNAELPIVSRFESSGKEIPERDVQENAYLPIVWSDFGNERFPLNVLILLNAHSPIVVREESSGKEIIFRAMCLEGWEYRLMEGQHDMFRL